MARHFGGLKIGRIHGIDLKIDVSLLFLLIYILIIGTAQFHSVVNRAGVDPSLLPGTPLGWTVLFAISLFASIVLHELGHSFVAQMAGVRVKNITLMMLGGVSEIGELPEKPKVEFKMAIAGPLVSFAIAGVLFWIRRMTASESIAFYCYWLGSVNFVLAIFNLLPAFPLDGGRALRALLANKKGMMRGTQIAVRVSRAFAWTLGIIGFFQFNVLLMFIAFFIYSAANTELIFLISKNLLKGIRVEDISTWMDPIDSTDSISHAATCMRKERTTVLPVEFPNGRAGIIGLQDLKAIPVERWQTTSVSEVVDPLALRTLNGAESVDPTLIARSPERALPVKKDGVLAGVIRYADIEELLALRSLEESTGIATAKSTTKSPTKVA